MALAISRLIQLLENLLGQALAQLDTPLVEGVDVPNGTLGEGEVLVVDNQSTELSGTDVAANQDAGSGTVTQEDLVLHQVLRSALGLDLLCGLADHKSLSLCQVVGCQHLLVQVVGDGVVGLSGQDEIRRNELCALVHQLEEGVLSICAGLTEQDWSSGVLGGGAVRSGALAVRLHGELLEVGREAVQVLVKRSDQVCLRVVEVAVPDAEETGNGGNVLLQWGRTEVLVHLVSTCQELLKVLITNVQSNGKTNGAPDRVTTTDPALETKHVVGVDAELGDLRLVCGQSDEVLRDITLAARLLEEPGLGSVGIGGSLGGGEGLGGDQEEDSLRIGVGESLCHVSAVNVGDEVECHVLGSVVLEGLGDHDGSPNSHGQLLVIAWFFTPQQPLGDSQRFLNKLTNQNHQYQH